MKITINGKKGGIEVDVGDKIIFNGSAYILISKRVFSGWHYYSPSVSKTTFNKLLKGGFVKLLDKKYKSPIADFECDMYEICKTEERG